MSSFIDYNTVFVRVTENLYITDYYTLASNNQSLSNSHSNNNSNSNSVIYKDICSEYAVANCTDNCPLIDKDCYRIPLRVNKDYYYDHNINTNNIHGHNHHNNSSNSNSYDNLEDGNTAGYSYDINEGRNSNSAEINMYLTDSIQWIRRQILLGNKVLLYCNNGVSRSVTVALIFLMNYYKTNLSTSLQQLQQKKSNISPNYYYIQQLISYELLLFRSNSYTINDYLTNFVNSITPSNHNNDIVCNSDSNSDTLANELQELLLTKNNKESIYSYYANKLSQQHISNIVTTEFLINYDSNYYSNCNINSTHSNSTYSDSTNNTNNILLFPITKFSFFSTNYNYINSKNILKVFISIDQKLDFIVLVLIKYFETYGIRVVVTHFPEDAKVFLIINSSIVTNLHNNSHSNTSHRSNSYEIQVREDQIYVLGSDYNGLLYGTHTMIQYMKVYGTIINDNHNVILKLQTICISDTPEISSRSTIVSNISSFGCDTISTIEFLSKCKLNTLYLVIDGAITGDNLTNTMTIKQYHSNIIHHSNYSNQLQSMKDSCLNYGINIIPTIIISSIHYRYNTDRLLYYFKDCSNCSVQF